MVAELIIEGHEHQVWMRDVQEASTVQPVPSIKMINDKFKKKKNSICGVSTDVYQKLN